MMYVENTKENRTVRNVAASMAIENMYADKEFILEMLKVANGEKDVEEVLEEIKREYGRS